MNLAVTKDAKDGVRTVSLGQGQGPKATAAINEGFGTGAWIVLQNCHLATSYMPTLEGIVENFEANMDTISPQFRLWLTAMPDPNLPVSVLQNGIKMTVEPPKGLKANLIRAYLAYDPQWFESSTKPHTFKKMLFGLSFFHALILERRKFGPLGWNIRYEFSDPDRHISSAQLKMFLEEYTTVQWSALNYMAAECNYGGRVTDAQDRKTIVKIMGDFYTPEILDPSYKFSTSGIYYCPPDTNIDGYLEYIESLPLNESPEVFWLHNNADLTALINESMSILRTAVSLLPRGGGGEGKSPEETYSEVAAGIQEQLPSAPFDIEAVTRKYPTDYNESMNTVLPQELLRFNKLFKVVADSCRELQKAVKGLAVMTPDLEEVGNAFLDNKVPQLWRKAPSYPSLKPLGGYVADFLSRLQFMTEWIDEGPPVVFWISGFFFTQAFLTGVKQNMARKFKVPIDKVIWNYHMQSAKSLPSVHTSMWQNDFQAPEKGCYVYGLFIQGARWDEEAGGINESFPKVLFEEVPVIWMEAVAAWEDGTPANHYLCPVYKESARKGVLSTTGHSSNHVIDMMIPVLEKHVIKGDPHKYWTRRGVALLTQLDD
mmetsp:Transcript_23676/g.50569  ORF Transcript_23676/g.50569 Transcript_23676/m.50569 type:complete len:599 (+) Transcript_23676:3-1799(+)